MDMDEVTQGIGRSMLASRYPSTPDNFVDLLVAGGTYRFALPLQAQMEIERCCRVPFGEVAARVMRGRGAISETETAGLLTEAGFGALDLNMIIVEGFAAGGNSGSLPGAARWTIEQQWTLAAAIIGAMFYGAPAATNLPGAVPNDRDG